MKYDNFEISTVYSKSRAFPPETLKLWTDSIGEAVPFYRNSSGSLPCTSHSSCREGAQQRASSCFPAETKTVNYILDLGCGTGRFTRALADHYKAEITGIDLSEKMLKEASEQLPEIEFKRGSAEDIPFPDKSFDLVFMSMVYHHIENKDKAMNEITRILKNGKYLCIRNSAIESMYDVLYLKYFPAAIELNKARLPSRKSIIGKALKAGLEFVSHRLIIQKFTDSFAEYCDKISLRGLSDLTLIPDKEFRKGIAKMKADIKKYPGPVFEPVELFIFRKT